MHPRRHFPPSYNRRPRIFDLMVDCGCFSAMPPVFSEPSSSRNLSANLSSMPWYKVTSNLTGELEKQLPSVEDIQNRIKWASLKFVKSIFTVCSYRVYLHFDHHLTTTVQSPLKMPKKPVVTTNNRLFLVLAATVQNQQNSRFNVGLYGLVVVLRQLRHGGFLTLFCAIQRCLHLQKRGGQR